MEREDSAAVFDRAIDEKVLRKVTNPQRNLITFIHYLRSERSRSSPSVVRFICIVNTCPACLRLFSPHNPPQHTHADFFFNKTLKCFPISHKWINRIFQTLFVISSDIGTLGLNCLGCRTHFSAFHRRTVNWLFRVIYCVLFILISLHCSASQSEFIHKQTLVDR